MKADATYNDGLAYIKARTGDGPYYGSIVSAYNERCKTMTPAVAATLALTSHGYCG